MKTMTEPTSAGVAGFAGWKMLGGLAAVFAIAAGLAAVVVMCMTPPRHLREWVVGIISTIMGSVGGGAAVVMHFGLQAWANEYLGLVALIGLCFACGLPAWALVRAIFTYIDKQKGKDIVQVAKELRRFGRGKAQ